MPELAKCLSLASVRGVGHPVVQRLKARLERPSDYKECQYGELEKDTDELRAVYHVGLRRPCDQRY